MTLLTDHPKLPTIRELFENSEMRFDAVAAQLLQRRGEIDDQICAFCAVEDLPAPKAGPLAGLPLSVKDQFHIAGTHATFGMGQPIGPQSKQDAPALAALLKNGARIIGRTNLPPFAMDFQALDGAGRRTNNPHDLTRTSGGSSGGGAAAVASGMSLADIGADLSGSLRIPTSFCGVMSLVPTDGQFSSLGMLAAETQELAHFARPGVIGRRADDLWVVYQFMRGATSLPEPLTRDKAEPIRIGWAVDEQRHPLCADVAGMFAAWRAAQDPQLVSIGSLEQDLFALDRRQEFAFLMGYETGGLLTWTMRQMARLFGGESGRRSPDFLAQIYRGYGRSKSQYDAGLKRRQRFIQSSLDMFDEFDVVMAPVTPMTAFQHVAPSQDRNGIRDYRHSFEVGQQAIGYLDALTYYTGGVSLLGFPVVTVPLGLTAGGLPVGAQMIGHPGKEKALLSVAAALFG